MWSNDGYSDQTNGQSSLPYGTGVALVDPTGQPGQRNGLTPLQAAPLVPAQPLPSTAMDGAGDIPVTLMERIELCKFLAGANLLPKALQEQPANVLLIMHKALALDLPLSVAIEHLHVIDGHVGHSAELLRALLYRNGHLLRWSTLTDKQVTGELILRHDPRNPRSETFTIADASRMELVNKANWRKDPVSMMVARCTTRLISRHCPEIAVAIGNLSAMDVLDDETPAATATPVVSEDNAVDIKALAADELLIEAQAATTSDELKDIGARARTQKLLEVVVEGGLTLQVSLLHLLEQLTKQVGPDGKRAAASGKETAK